MANVVAGDHEIRPFLIYAPDEKMNVGVVRIPVVDGHPVEPRAKISLHLFGEVAGESPKVGHVACVLGRDDEAEMVAVVLAAFCESGAVSAVAAGIEHLGSLAAAGHAVALQV